MGCVGCDCKKYQSKGMQGEPTLCYKIILKHTLVGNSLKYITDSKEFIVEIIKSRFPNLIFIQIF